MFKLHELALALEANVKSWTYTPYDSTEVKIIYTGGVELGRPQNPSLHKGIKAFLWLDNIPEKLKRMGSKHGKAMVNGQLISLISGTDREQALTIYQITTEVIETLSTLNLGIEGCQVIVPDKQLADIKPVILGSDMDNPDYCLGSMVDFKVIIPY
jgi:hypothetical protein